MTTKKIFWTDKRVEALGKTFITVFQIFLAAAVAGGVLGKLTTWLKILFIICTVISFALGIYFADKNSANNKE